MKAGCAAQKLQFEAHGKRDVVADFDGGRMTSEGGGLLLREANCCLGDLMARLGQCVSDFRQQGSVEHTATDLIAQRVCALALGYEDLNDHGTLLRHLFAGRLPGSRWSPSSPSSPRFHCLPLNFSVPLRHHGAALSRAAAPTAHRSVHETVVTSPCSTTPSCRYVPGTSPCTSSRSPRTVFRRWV